MWMVEIMPDVFRAPMNSLVCSVSKSVGHGNLALSNDQSAVSSYETEISNQQ